MRHAPLFVLAMIYIGLASCSHKKVQVVRSPANATAKAPRAFPAHTCLIYAGNYQVTVRPLPKRRGKHAITIRYNPNIGFPVIWAPLAEWQVVDSLIVASNSTTLRSFHHKGHAIVFSIGYPTTEALLEYHWHNKSIIHLVIGIDQPMVSYKGGRITTSYAPTINWLPLPPNTRVREYVSYNGLELLQSRQAALVMQEISQNLSSRQFMGILLSVAPLLVAPEMEIGEGLFEGEGAATAIGEEVVGGTTAAENEVVGATRALAGMRLTGRGMFGAFDESYVFDAGGTIRSTGPFESGRIVGHLRPNGYIEGSGLVLQGQVIRWMEPDGSLFSGRSIDGFVGRIQPDGKITTLFGDKIGTLAK